MIVLFVCCFCMCVCVVVVFVVCREMLVIQEFQVGMVVWDLLDKQAFR